MRILATFLLFLSVSFGFEMPQVRAILSDVKDGGARIENSDKIVLGSSGVVIRNFKNGESSIIELLLQKKMAHMQMCALKCLKI